MSHYEKVNALCAAAVPQPQDSQHALLSFTLMSCNTDNVADDLSLIWLSLACLVIDP